jgi:hypothetical protein
MNCVKYDKDTQPEKFRNFVNLILNFTGGGSEYVRKEQ